MYVLPRLAGSIFNALDGCEKKNKANASENLYSVELYCKALRRLFYIRHIWVLFQVRAVLQSATHLCSLD